MVSVKTRVQSESGPATVQLRQCKLVVLSGRLKGREHIIASDLIRVGKSDENDIQVDEDTVSRSHFEIVRDSRGYLLRDLGSTNGTFLDGAEVREAYVRAGSRIAAGSCEFRFTPYDQRIEISVPEVERMASLVGGSLPMRAIYGLLERIAPTDATVLILGETGTGKDLIARSIHDLSRRNEQPFVVVDCGAVSASLIESEFFGHEKGAFTGAISDRKGAFEVASGGTVFLDELGELPLDLQPKLLRVLEQREVRRVGGSHRTRVDFRVVAATRKDLRAEVERGKFREDLYFRINVVPVVAPSLRDRREDIPLLVEHFLDILVPPDSLRPRLTDETLGVLMGHDWPGNVRELRNVVERALAIGRDPARLFAPLDAELPIASRRAGAEEHFEFSIDQSYREEKERWNDRFERAYLRWLMERARGNISQAARDASMDRKHLHKLLKKHDLEPHGG